MQLPPNHGSSAVRVSQLCTDLIRALDGSNGPVTPDGVDDRFGRQVTLREALSELSKRISVFPATSKVHYIDGSDDPFDPTGP